MSVRLAWAVTAALALCSAGATARPLVPPPGFTAPVIHKGKDVRDCQAPPAPPTGPLEFPSKYEGSDQARDDLNPTAYAEYRRLTEPITAMEKGVSAMVQSYLRTGQEDTLQCVVGWLDAWAAAHALEGEARNHTGKSMRKWALGSVASAYARLKFSSSQPLRPYAERTARIEDWLGRLGSRVVADWKDQPLQRINNHQYWAAWATMADAVALNRRDLFDWSVAQYRIAAHQIDAEGFLDNELKRDTRALAYHNYALNPLVMIAAFARANGVDVTGENDRALARLAERVLSGIDDPARFASRTGNPQDVEDLQGSSKFAWLEPYCWLQECDARLAQRVAALRPLKTHRLGGNLTELFGPPEAGTAAGHK